MKKTAFTLAEILISLVIIGIVAALTIPAFVQNYKKQEYSAKLKKFYSTMQQAIQMSELDNGPLENWDFSPAVSDEDGNYDYDTNHEFTKNWLNKYILPYLKYTKVTEGGYIPEDEENDAKDIPVEIYLNDGSTALMWLGNCMDIIYDVNGNKFPNTSGQDRYSFTFCFAHTGKNPESSGFRPYLSGDIKSRTDALKRCGSNQPQFCSSLLQYDSWEFKKDYPFKL